MTKLQDLFFEHRSKVVDKWEQYFGIYETELFGIVSAGRPITLLEVGVQNGGSLELWQKYLPAGSKIVGADIDAKCGDLRFDSPDISVHVVDAADPYAMQRVFKDQSFDIIIDDGSHISSDIIATFKLMFPFLKGGGKYIIEDLECSYYKTHEGGLLDPRSSIEWLKLVVDAVNADHIDRGETIPAASRDIIDRYRHTVGRVTFYDSAAAIEKLRTPKQRPFRRMLSGQACDLVPAFDLLALQPQSVYEPMFFGSTAARQLDQSIINAYEVARKRLGDVDAEVAKVRDEERAASAAAKATSASLYELLAVKDAHIATLTTENTLKDRSLQELTLNMRDSEDALARSTADLSKAEIRAATMSGLVKLVEGQGKLLPKSWRFVSPAMKTDPGDRLQGAASNDRPMVKRVLSRVLRRVRAVHPRARAVLGRDLKNALLASCIIRDSGLFDREFYSDQNPDIDAMAGDPVLHYVQHGAAEERDPCVAFSTSGYKDANPDVAEWGINPFVHYILYGAREDRDPKPMAVPVRHHDDDPLPEVLEAESIVRESGLFDADWYLGHYEDVRIAASGPFRHFMDHGLWEDRQPNPMFDPVWYRTNYPDITAANANPFLHYLQWGAFEGRSPCVGFEGHWYLENNPDVVASGENPLKHYMRLGRQEGRLPSDPNAAYRQYVLTDRQTTIAEGDEIRRHITIMTVQPRFVIFVEGADEQLRSLSQDALTRQFYPGFHVLDARKISDLREPAEDQRDHYLLWLSAGDILHDRALYEFASEINTDSTLKLLYADEDVMVEGARAQPFFKPDWSPDYLESLDYIGGAACFGMDGAWQDVLSASSRYDFVLKYTERHPRAAHIRKVLCHRRRIAADAAAIDSDQAALSRRLLRTGRRALLTPVVQDRACFDVKVDLRQQPLVSVVIPTAGKVVDLKGRSVDLLFHCVDEIVARSTYKNLEFVIVDNGDLDQARADILDRRGYTRLTFSEPEFNIARKLNLGAEAAKGDLLLLLNDDVEPLVPDWIERLVEHFEKPHVGVVGSKLLYTDMTTQHVGVVLNAGVPDHVRRFRPRNDEGYFFSTAAVRNFVAVTGACMMTRASIYKQVGGYTEALPVNYNDTDYCLKVIETGKTVVYAPRSELIHFESQSREARVEPSEGEYFAERWAAYGVSDPFYNERNLTVASPTFEISNNPRTI